MNSQLVRASQFLSRVLRHQPQKYGLTLDPHGWAPIDEVIAAAQRAGILLTHPMLQQIVADNDKQRFAISEDGHAIRARQGHSIPIDLELAALEPPSQLYHGTAQRFLSSIRTRDNSTFPPVRPSFCRCPDGPGSRTTAWSSCFSYSEL